MILPAIVVGIVGRAALRYAIGAGAQYMARRGAQAAIRRVMQRGLRQAEQRLRAERARLARCKNCKRLEDRVNPCQFLRRGNPMGSGPYRGGSYAGVRGSGIEAHHAPASSAYMPGGISYGRRPAIQMDPEDHARTASYGNSAAATQYQRQQARLMSQGKFMQAFAMDMADVMANFPDGKYSEALAEAAAYAACLEKFDKTGSGGRGRR